MNTLIKKEVETIQNSISTLKVVRDDGNISNSTLNNYIDGIIKGIDDKIEELQSSIREWELVKQKIQNNKY